MESHIILNSQALAREVLERSRNEQEEIKIKELEETVLKLRVSPSLSICRTFLLHVLKILVCTCFREKMSNSDQAYTNFRFKRKR